MGFFSLKTVCGACGKEAGLNRFRLRKSKECVCLECFKKAGGLGVVDVSKVTIEDIKSVIKKNEEKLKRDPMKTATGMYKYCIDNNFGSGFNDSRGLKHFGVIEGKLKRC